MKKGKHHLYPIAQASPAVIRAASPFEVKRVFHSVSSLPPDTPSIAAFSQCRVRVAY